jgi:hypothetical protein
VTRSGGTAKNWRNSYNDQAGHKTGRLPAKPYKHKLKSKKQWFKEFKDGVHNDLPASIAKVRATADQRFIFKKALEHLHSINNEDFEAAKEHKEFLADIDKIEELIGVWLYMENFLDAVTEMKDELEARLLGWEGKIDV